MRKLFKQENSSKTYRDLLIGQVSRTVRFCIKYKRT